MNGDQPFFLWSGLPDLAVVVAILALIIAIIAFYFVIRNSK